MPLKHVPSQLQEHFAIDTICGRENHSFLSAFPQVCFPHSSGWPHAHGCMRNTNETYPNNGLNFIKLIRSFFLFVHYSLNFYLIFLGGVCIWKYMIFFFGRNFIVPSVLNLTTISLNHWSGGCSEQQSIFQGWDLIGLFDHCHLTFSEAFSFESHESSSVWQCLPTSSWGYQCPYLVTIIFYGPVFSWSVYALNISLLPVQEKTGDLLCYIGTDTYSRHYKFLDTWHEHASLQ